MLVRNLWNLALSKTFVICFTVLAFSWSASAKAQGIPYDISFVELGTGATKLAAEADAEAEAWEAFMAEQDRLMDSGITIFAISINSDELIPPTVLVANDWLALWNLDVTFWVDIMPLPPPPINDPLDDFDIILPLGGGVDDLSTEIIPDP